MPPLKEQEMEGKDRALREAQEKESSLSAVAQNAKAELEMQLKELESKFASESHEWEARQAAFKAEKSKLTQDIGKVTQERDGIKKQNADLQEQAARVQAEAEVADLRQGVHAAPGQQDRIASAAWRHRNVARGSLPCCIRPVARTRSALRPRSPGQRRGAAGQRR